VVERGGRRVLPAGAAILLAVAERYGADAVRAPASVITFDSDPRNHPEVLAHPAAIVIGGARLR